ncbi:hypothetical protein ACHQM5_001650 [Ranunculus cassubicifolius]
MEALKNTRSSLPFPCPKSPPKYPDMSGKRKEFARVQMLEREIGFLEEELKSCECLQLASKGCKEVDDFVVANPDPLIPTNQKIRKSCWLWKWLCCGKPCFNLSWICCCFSGCSVPTCPTCCPSGKKLFSCPNCCSCCPSCRCNCCCCFGKTSCPKCCKLSLPSCPKCTWSCFKCPHFKCPQVCLCFSCRKTCCCNPCYLF